jgi:hypothetical protein
MKWSFGRGASCASVTRRSSRYVLGKSGSGTPYDSPCALKPCKCESSQPIAASNARLTSGSFASLAISTRRQISRLYWLDAKRSALRRRTSSRSTVRKSKLREPEPPSTALGTIHRLKIRLIDVRPPHIEKGCDFLEFVVRKRAMPSHARVLSPSQMRFIGSDRRRGRTASTQPERGRPTGRAPNDVATGHIRRRPKAFPRNQSVLV